MATHSGKLAVISYGGTEVSTIGDWTLTEDAANDMATASNTGGAPIATAGIKDSKGSFSAFSKNLPLVPGVASATLIGDTGFSKVSVAAFITQAKLSIDYASFKKLEWQVDFEGSGTVTYTSTSSLSPAAAPLMFSCQGGKINWQPINGGTLGSAANLPSPQSAELTFANPLDSYAADSATSLSKVYGVPLTCKGSFVLKDDAFAAISTGATNYRPGDQGILKIYVNATEFYTIKYASIDSVTPGPVDAKTGKITTQTVNFSWTAWGSLTAGLDRGTLISPDATVLWS